MLSAFKIPKKYSVPASIFKPILPLLPESSSNVVDKEKSDYITMELISGPDGTGKYKKHLAHFDEGTPQEWIDTQKAMVEVWTQNSVTSPANRVAIIKAILRGETLTTFETAVAEGQKGADGAILDLTMVMLEEALAAVSNSIFPTEP